ncbi:hypothetical protein HMPREF3227_00164 [Corynebacterium sp. CMW7794]|uniref:hypothetical protein n=1 Tax=Corynebacterium TaxID=1716 RepID=UPI00079B8BA9|nr:MULTISPECIES: hypothetical protein [Corynebacterium]KXB54752.1 hypothetical protein HMPREF0307_01503 [Corynebacterium sp. DNF00584]KXI19789.1 hypothetical protein HMPREF3227_00164 [Corynebacterium sp. CMW7794]MBF9010857.1 hypothetical protein [Corynebacterium phoceense]MCQ9331639.1 hypothetical protein [Corynebacterium phoceense]MCQ9349016.1 hypothetical protein [Corynebacterium phoceense]
MRSRLTAALVSTTLALSAVAVPQATAAPIVNTRTSQHGTPLCTLEHAPEDTQAADAVIEAYKKVLTAASEEVQAQFPEDKDTFAAFTTRDVKAAAGYPELLKKFQAKGYNAQDVLVILVAANNVDAIISDEAADKLLGDNFPEASINRAMAMRDSVPTGARAELLSASTAFSSQFRTILAKHESEVGLQATIDSFESTAGNDAVKDAWEKCISELKAKGATPGYQPVPEIEVPITNGTGNDGSSGGSSQGTAIGILIAIAVLTVGAAYVVNTPGGFKLPNFNLPFPLGA